MAENISIEVLAKESDVADNSREFPVFYDAELGKYLDIHDRTRECVPKRRYFLCFNEKNELIISDSSKPQNNVTYTTF